MSFREVPKRIRRLRASVPVQRLGGTPLGVWIIKHLVSPIDRHIYRLTGGRRVSTGRPLGPMLLLTTTGRRTGKEHTTPLFYLRNDERLIICNVNRPVYHPERHGYLARYEEFQEEAQRLLEEQVEEVKAAGGVVAGSHLGMGRPDEEIVVLGEEVGADLIVTGNRGLGGIRRALMGSVSESVVRHAYCPVLVVRPEKEPAT
jgi:nucleotide-binding universal stress UspA family protein